MQYGDKRCRKCNCAMELIADAPPMNGAGLIVWSCPQCDAVESVLTPATRSHPRDLILVISVRGCLSHSRWLSRFCDYHYRLSLI
jgi:hypothetical protein